MSELVGATVATRVGAPSSGSRTPRVLYIYPETMGLSPEPARNPLHYLSRYLCGDYIAIWVVDDAKTARQKALAGSAANGRFRFHWTRVHALPFGLRRVWEFLFWVGKGVGLSARHGRFDAVVVYGPFTTALAGIVIRLFTGAKLIVEFPGHPFRSYDHYSGWVNRLKRRLAPHWTRWIARTADHVRLLYPTQLAELNLDVSGKLSAFHDFTTVSAAMHARASADAADASGKYVLFLGFPFHLKGVDILIRAFGEVSDRFPKHRLLVVGHCPDPSPYEKLAAGNSRIEIRKAVSHEKAMALMSNCSVFVLPSRTEGMARVLLEAMGAGRPVISSAVGGIPFYIEHGRTGLLFESENVAELASHLAQLLGDPDYAEEIGKRGRLHVESSLTEWHYAQQFRDMIDRTVE